jgi:hypothetical protein
MNSQEIKNMHLLYNAVYDKNLREEIEDCNNTENIVEVASQYFYEMGLNEEGVEIVIEELGLEGFVEFVSDLSEEYVLTEAKFDRLPPVSKSGKPIASLKGGAKSSAIKSKRQIRTVLRQKIDTESQSKPSGMKAALHRQSAIATAKEQQPKKKGVLDRVAGAVLKGIERHNAAMSDLKKMGAATQVTAGKVRKAAGEFKKGFTSEEIEHLDELEIDEKFSLAADPSKPQSPKPTVLARTRRVRNNQGGWNPNAKGEVLAQRARRVVGTRRREDRETGVTNEELDIYDIILSHLLDEGYASTEEAADKIILNMSESWFVEILDEEMPSTVKSQRPSGTIKGKRKPKSMPMVDFGKKRTWDDDHPSLSASERNSSLR